MVKNKIRSTKTPNSLETDCVLVLMKDDTKEDLQEIKI